MTHSKILKSKWGLMAAVAVLAIALTPAASRADWHGGHGGGWHGGHGGGWHGGSHSSFNFAIGFGSGFGFGGYYRPYDCGYIVAPRYYYPPPRVAYYYAPPPAVAYYPSYSCSSGYYSPAPRVSYGFSAGYYYGR